MAKMGVTDAFITAISNAFQDAAVQGVTVCVATGDRGTDSNVGDGKVHVQYPASDPWVLAVGGTTIGDINGSLFDEYVWNDPDGTNWGTTGGGVSARFPVPSYQGQITVPASLNDPTHHGRGLPDVAGNANIASGYSGIVVAGSTGNPGNGTSASAPQWAGLIAVMNAALGVNLGFVNPALYALAGAGFRDIIPGAGPTDNANAGAPGYPAGPGWDACTGWGSPDGQTLLAKLRSIYVIHRLRSSQGAAITITHTIAFQGDPGLSSESTAQNVMVIVKKGGAQSVGGAFMPNTQDWSEPQITLAPGQSLSFSPHDGSFVCNMGNVVFESSTAGGSSWKMFPQIAIEIDGEWQDDPVQGLCIHNFNFVF
jgi:hypothetical protein